MAKALKRQGFRFVGPTTAYALMQATGMVNDHLAGCAFRSARRFATCPSATTFPYEHVSSAVDVRDIWEPTECQPR